MSGARHKEKDIFGLFGNHAGKAIKSTRPEPTYEMSDSPVIGYVLLREMVSREQIIAALDKHIHDEDTLAWDGLGGGCSAFLQAALGGGLEVVFEGLRWPGWQDVVADVELSQGIFLYPPPSTVGSSDVSKVARSVVSLGELLGTA